ncbi:N-glycosylase/DNA lyase [Candidatus Woesearchaeota archaeon]|nr:N-glycosylase/DNA lyase [Candidatus Woesearchaeota archaeon]
MKLNEQILKLRNSPVKDKIDSRIKEFESFEDKSTEAWFSELCFCLLTANWKARGSIEIQKELCDNDFCSLSEDHLKKYLKEKGHRFWPQRAERICRAREHIDIKIKITKIVKTEGQKKARDWLIKNILGIGYKEASHFLRNTGHLDLAIIDRHIMFLMIENSMIKKRPKTLTRKRYLFMEKKLTLLADNLNMRIGELDLYMFYLKKREVLK